MLMTDEVRNELEDCVFEYEYSSVYPVECFGATSEAVDVERGDKGIEGVEGGADGIEGVEGGGKGAVVGFE